MKNEKIIAIIIGILFIGFVGLAIFYGRSWSFTGTPLDISSADSFILDASIAQKSFTIGTKEFEHVSFTTTLPEDNDDDDENDYDEDYLFIDTVTFKYNGVQYTAHIGDVVPVTEWLTIKVISFEYKRSNYVTQIWKVRYLAYIDPDVFLDADVVDTQQKLLNNDVGSLYVCNKLTMSFPGVMSTVEDYQNSAFDKLITENPTWVSGCKEYNVTLNPPALGEFDARYYPGVVVKEYIGTIKEDEDVRGDGPNKYYMDYQVNDKNIYSRNGYFYPYVSVNEIKERVGINCVSTPCPAGFSCMQKRYAGVDYQVCMKSTIAITNPVINDPIIVQCSEGNNYCIDQDANIFERIWAWILSIWNGMFG